MPKLVCVKCQRQLRPETNGATVIDYASFGPYKVWDADIWKCPECGQKIVAGFAEHPFMEHWHTDFAERLKQLVSRVAQVVRNFETKEQREEFENDDFN